jgi:hypothetical protein
VVEEPLQDLLFLHEVTCNQTLVSKAGLRDNNYQVNQWNKAGIVWV